jgi:hypothetical protein
MDKHQIIKMIRTLSAVEAVLLTPRSGRVD